MTLETPISSVASDETLRSSAQIYGIMATPYRIRAKEKAAVV